jgi:hypothetical protein
MSLQELLAALQAMVLVGRSQSTQTTQIVQAFKTIQKRLPCP